MTRKARRVVVVLSLCVVAGMLYGAQRVASWRPQELFRVKRTADGFHTLTLSPGDNVLLADSTLWDLSYRSSIRELPPTSERFLGFCDDQSYWSDDGMEQNTQLDKTISRRDVRSGKRLWNATISFPRHSDVNGYVQDIQLSSDFRFVFVATTRYDSCFVSMFDARTGRCLKKMAWTQPCFFADRGRLLIRPSEWNDQTDPAMSVVAAVWADLENSWSLECPGWPDSEQIGTDAEGRIVWLCDSDKRHLLFLDAKTGKRLWSAPFVNDTLRGRPLLAFSPKGRFVAVANSTEIQVFETLTGKHVASRVVPNVAQRYTASAVQLQDDGGALYTLERDGRVLRWRLQ